METLARSPKQLGTAISQARRGKNLSQTELAQKLGIRQATVSSLENGSVATRIDIICDALATLDLELVVRPRSKSTAKNIEDIF